VISFSVIEHAPSRQISANWIAEMARVTKKNGRLTISTNNKLNLLCFILSPFKALDVPAHANFLIYLLVLTKAYIIFWISGILRILKHCTPANSTDCEFFFKPKDILKILYKNNVNVESWRSDIPYYWGYGPPGFAFSDFALKIDRGLSSFNSSWFGLEMAFLGRKIKKLESYHCVC
jgi:DNA modification methylase